MPYILVKNKFFPTLQWNQGNRICISRMKNYKIPTNLKSLLDSHPSPQVLFSDSVEPVYCNHAATLDLKSQQFRLDDTLKAKLINCELTEWPSLFDGEIATTRLKNNGIEYILVTQTQTPLELPSAMSSLQLSLCILDKMGKVIGQNHHFKKLVGKEIEHVRDLNSLCDDPILFSPAIINNNQTWREACLCTEQETTHIEYCIAPYNQDFLLQIRDISRHKAKLIELSVKATTDPLTGLTNRSIVGDRLQQIINRSARNKEPFAFVLLDLNEFKLINDSFGHKTGDELLKHIACRLTQSLRATDTCARLGGDEFCIILENIKDRADLLLLLKKINSKLSKQVVLGEHVLLPKASIGACLSTGKETLDEVYQHADTAMYQAKQNAFNNIRIYCGDKQKYSVTLFHPEQGLDYDNFTLHFQPILCTDSHSLKGIESFLRVKSTQKASLPKDLFKYAQAKGKLGELENWVLEEACKTRSLWQQAQMVSDDVPICVNISNGLLYKPGFTKQLKQLIAQYQIHANMLELDIHEGCLIANPLAAEKVLNKLHEMGVKLAIDDFGKGSISIATLYQHPIQRVKIAKELISNAHHDDWALVKTIIDIAKQLNIQVVAQGIETEQLLTQITNSKCDAYQGYLIAKPQALNGLHRLINRFNKSNEESTSQTN